MNRLELKPTRKQRGWTQAKTAAYLGVSQSYLALLEGGKRQPGPKLARKAVKMLKLRATALPLPERLSMRVDSQRLAQQLGSLGYLGFAYLRATKKRNPAEVLLTALAQENLESRLTEALPWLLLHYPDMDREWLVRQARMHNLSNRLGFVVTLAKGALARPGETRSTRYQALVFLEAKLREGRLDREDTLCQASLSQGERVWLRQTRPQEAADWHLLTDWKPEHLQYAL